MAKPRRYGTRGTGNTTVMSNIHPDCAAELRAFAAKHQLTTSGAVHHLLRIALNLPPLENLDG